MTTFQGLGPLPCPECVVGKCANCDGRAWDTLADCYTVCPCNAAGHPGPAVPPVEGTPS